MLMKAASFDILKSLEVFITVADTESMTISARRLNITQSAVSQQIRMLEEFLRVELFDRKTRPIKLTRSGNILIFRGKRLIAEAKEALSYFRQASETRLPDLRLALFSTLMRPLVPALMAAVDNHELAVQTLSIMRCFSRNLMQDLANGEIDAAITVDDPLEEGEGLERHQLIRECYILMVPKGVAEESIDLQVLAKKLPYVCYNFHVKSARLVARHFQRLRLDITPKFTVDLADNLIAGVAAGHCWSVVVPSQVAYLQPDTAAIDFLPFPKPGLNRNIVLIVRQAEFPTVAEQIAELCRRVVRTELVPRVKALLPHIPDVFSVMNDDASLELESARFVRTGIGTR